MSDHLSNSRQLAFRAVGYQVLATALTGLMAWIAIGADAGTAVVIGGGSIALGNAVMAQLSLGGGIQVPKVAFARLLLGAIFKWLVVVLIWLGAMAVLKKAPLAAVFGLLVAMSVHPIAILFGAKVKRER